MLGIRKPLQIESTIGSAMRVAGPCAFQGGLEIAGNVTGDVQAEAGAPSLLVIAAGARVEGAVQADQVIIGGTVVGPVLARERLELLPTARIEGDVCYQALEMRPGATVIGQLQPQAMLATHPLVTGAGPKPIAAAEVPTGFEPTEPILEPEDPQAGPGSSDS